MAGSRRSGGTNVALTTRKRRSGGGWVDLTIAKRRVGGAWADLFPGVSVSPSFAEGSQFQQPGPETLYVVSNNVTASGAASYTWSRISGASAITATNPSAAITAFHGTVSSGQMLSATFRVTGNNGGTFDVAVTLTYSNGQIN